MGETEAVEAERRRERQREREVSQKAERKNVRRSGIRCHSFGIGQWEKKETKEEEEKKKHEQNRVSESGINFH